MDTTIMDIYIYIVGLYRRYIGATLGIVENEMVAAVISSIFLLLLCVLSSCELSFISSGEPVWEYLGSILGSGFLRVRGVQGCLL